MLHLEENVNPDTEESNEVDFFEEHETFDLHSNEPNIPTEEKTISNPTTCKEDTEKNETNTSGDVVLNSVGPSVKLSESLSSLQSERKPTIGGRKIQSKRPGLGKKAGGLGAQRVKTNFDELEKSVIEVGKETHEAESNDEVATRLAYRYEQNLSQQAKKVEERAKQMDPTKAGQAERLGMGFNARSGASHSALGDMKTITQESSAKTITATESRSRDIDVDRDLFMNLDEFYTALLTPYSNNSNSKVKSEEVTVIAEPEPPKRQPLLSRSSNSKNDNKTSVEGEAQKKFGSAKAISSDQYFQDSNHDDSWERKSNLRRFEGSSSISSADYFGTGNSSPTSPTTSLSARLSGAHTSVVDLDDVRESVRQSVNKVAGRISSLANAAVSSIQDRYGL